MELKMTEKQFRRLLDLVYIGNWVLNSTRGDDRIKEYDQVESLVFAHCLDHGMAPLTELYQGELIPSRAFADGGIHEAIMAYEDATFFEILAQELAMRDMDDPPITPENYDEIMARMEAYLGEVEQHGTDNITEDMDESKRDGGSRLVYLSSAMYSMMSPTSQSSILQNTSMVWVLTLSFRFIRVICPGLTPYFLISAYCDTPFSFMVAQSFSYEIITRKPPLFTCMITEKGVY